jgi:hypothetical protein
VLSPFVPGVVVVPGPPAASAVAGCVSASCCFRAISGRTSSPESPSEIGTCCPHRSPRRFVQVLQARLIHREEDERVPKQPRRITAGLKDGFCRDLGGIPRLLGVGMVDTEHDEPRVHVVGHVLSGLRHGMDAAEVARPAQIGPQPLIQLVHHLVRIALELLGAVLSELRDRGLRRVPVARAVLVEVGSGAGEPPERVAEDRGRFSGHHTTKLHSPILNPAVGSGRRGRGA